MGAPAIPAVYLVQDPAQAACLLNPLRAEILVQVREPGSAAGVARELGETPQRVNYHMKELEKVGLVRRAGTRTVRNLVEVLYQAVARTFVLSEAVAGSPARARQMRDQGSLAHLVTVADRLRRDALVLLEQSDAETQVPSASLAGKVRLRDEAERHAFMRDYMEQVRQLIGRYGGGSDDATAYTVLLAIYPETDTGQREGG